MRVDADAVNAFGQPAIDALPGEMSEFVEHAFANPAVVAGDTTPAKVAAGLRVTGEARTLATSNPTSLTMAAGAGLTGDYKPVKPYIERLHGDRFTVAYKLWGTRKEPYLRVKFAGYARTTFTHAGDTYTDLLSRDYTLYLTPNTANPADLNPGETYNHWWIAFYDESFVDYAPGDPVAVEGGGQ